MLKVMVVTKENAAAHAKRIESLQLAPDPVHHLSNVSTGMNIAVRCIPKNGQKPTPGTLFPWR